MLEPEAAGEEQQEPLVSHAVLCTFKGSRVHMDELQGAVHWWWWRVWSCVVVIGVTGNAVMWVPRAFVQPRVRASARGAKACLEVTLGSL